jgi:endogenous inhibitor of DNA gyrase (YacG/DUF329 family)
MATDGSPDSLAVNCGYCGRSCVWIEDVKTQRTIACTECERAMVLGEARLGSPRCPSATLLRK